MRRDTRKRRTGPAPAGRAARRTAVAAVLALSLSAAASCSRGGGQASAASACGSAPRASAASPPAGPAAGAAERRVATQAGKLLVVVLENHSACGVARGMPGLSATADRYGRASRSFGLAHPSLPNYLAIAGGSTFSVRDDGPPADHRLAGTSVFGQVLAAGKVAKTYAEGMTGTCALRPSGRYAVKHNPWPYFTAERSACRRYDVPSGTTAHGALRNDIVAGTMPAFALLIPDLCHDAHDCSLATADQWLHRWLTLMLAGPDFRAGRLAVVVTFDEDDQRAGNHILTAVLHPSLRGKAVGRHLDHHALSRAVSGLAGRPGLRGARGAPDLLAAFGLSTPS